MSGRYVALCGGVGGAKLALGLDKLLGSKVTVVVNVGDDFEHLGLSICPDLDTVLYTLSGLNDRGRGWGRAGETWAFMGALAELGGESWFQLGDKDLALHIERTRRLKAGEPLSRVMADLAARLGIAAHICPVTNDRLRTMVETDEGTLAFQDYFVHRRCEPRVSAIDFSGASDAQLASGVASALASDDLVAVIICPSNPYLSVDPVLAVPGLKEAIRARDIPVVGVSPLIGAKAVKGPTAKIMQELGLQPSNQAIAAHYADLLNGLVIDVGDEADKATLPMVASATVTLMRSVEDSMRLAEHVLGFAAELVLARVPPIAE